jgi:hypothetical protein
MSLFCSYLEIYNESVFDLLSNKSEKDKLAVRRDSNIGGVSIVGSTE